MINNILLATIVGGGVTLCGVLPGAAAPRQKSFGSFESFESQAVRRAVQAAQVKRAVPPRAVPSAVRVVAPQHLVPSKAPNLANARRLAEAHAARGLAEGRDAAESVRNVPGFAAGNGGELNRNPGGDLTKRDRGLLGNGFAAGMANRNGSNSNGGFENPLGDLAPDLPSSKNYSAGLRPSGNLRDHAAGIAGTADVTKDPHGTVTKTWSYRDGADTVNRTSRHNPLMQTQFESTERVNRRRGTRDVHSTTHDHVFKTRTNFRAHFDRRGGSSTTTSRTGTGALYWRWVNYDADGNEVASGDSDGLHTGRAAGGGINRTLDPNADTNGGVMGPWIDVRPSHVTNPTKVNPGSAENLPGPQAPRINPGSSIVVNPSLTETTGPNRAIDPATARRMFEAAKPDPGGRPPRPE